jgi:hypothetical protein
LTTVLKTCIAKKSDIAFDASTLPMRMRDCGAFGMSMSISWRGGL